MKLSGKLNDQKSVLVERLSHWLKQVMEAGRTPAAAAEEGSDDEPCQPRQKHNIIIIPDATQIGEVPHDAAVTAEQAESALGHVQATDFDEDMLEMIDMDQRQEEEALVGRHVNRSNVDYSCLV